MVFFVIFEKPEGGSQHPVESQHPPRPHQGEGWLSACITEMFAIRVANTFVVREADNYVQSVSETSAFMYCKKMASPIQ